MSVKPFIEYIVIVKSNGNLVEILRSVKQGRGHVCVQVIKVKPVKNQLTGILIGYDRIGKVFENYGGFQREKDFNYKIAESVAIDNATSMIK